MPEIPLRKIIEAWRQENGWSQARIARELEIHPVNFSLILCHGAFPKKMSIDRFQQYMIDKLAALGVPVLSPTEKNFGAEGTDAVARWPLAKWLCHDAKISQQRLAAESGMTQPAVAGLLMGRIPERKSLPFAEFNLALTRSLGRHFPPAALEELWKPFTADEYAAYKDKYRKEENYMLTQDALKYYKFSRNPFAVDEPLKPDELYFSEAHREILDVVLQAAQGRKLAVLSGETGAGKSEMLKYAKNLLRRIPIALKDRVFGAAELEAMPRAPKNEQAYLIVEPAKQLAQMVQANNFLNLILSELGVGNLKQDILGKAVLLKQSLEKSEQKICLWIDEGNQMPADTLRSLKAFFELENEDGDERLLSVIIAGQPVGLKDRLAFISDLKEVELRSVQNLIKPFKNGDGRAYIESRLALVGRKTEDVFSEDGLAALLDKAERFGGATPARINKIAESALMWKFAHNPNAKIAGENEVLA